MQEIEFMNLCPTHVDTQILANNISRISRAQI